MPADSKAVTIEFNLTAGPAELLTHLYNQKGQSGGAYFTDVEWLGGTDSLPVPGNTKKK